MTQSCHKHPPEEYLLDYATGSLADPFALLVAAHACMCPDCHHMIHNLEMLGGFFALREQDEAASASDQESRLPDMPDIRPDRHKASHPDPEDPCRPDIRLPGWMAVPNLPHCLQTCLRNVPPPSAWPELLPGIRNFPLCTGSPSLNLLSFGQGVQAPRHGHQGLEMTLVLAGQLQDGNALFTPGDLAVCDVGDKHAPKAGSHMGCLCLWATEKDLVFI